MDTLKQLEIKECVIKKEIDLLKTNIVDPLAIQKIYLEFSLLWDEFGIVEKREVIRLLVKDVEVDIEKKSDKGKIKIALWDKVPKGKLDNYKIGSSFCSVELRR